MMLHPNLLAAAVAACLSIPLHAASAAAGLDTSGLDTATLDTILVVGRGARPASANGNVTVIESEQMEEEMARDFEDIVRYLPGVAVSDMGRFGNNGFNIRGLEGNRVAVTVDGLGFAESIETARAYEFFRAGRGTVDVDTLKRVEVVKGPDAIVAGSGALGGAVMFTTKDPADYLRGAGDGTHLGLRLGYEGASDERMGTVSFANRSGPWESMLVHTRREGQATESWYRTTLERTGSGRRSADPMERSSDSLLGKLVLAPDGPHRLGLVLERGRADSRIDNLSRVAAPGYLERYGDDRSTRDRYGLSYAWQAGRTAFDVLELRMDRVETLSAGLTTILAGTGCPGGVAPCLRTEDRATEQVQERAALDLDKTVDRGASSHRLLYGLAWERRDVDFTSIDTRWFADGSVASVTRRPSQVPRTGVSAAHLYLRDNVSLYQDRLDLHAGLRYDRHAYSPRLDEGFRDDTGSVRALSFSSAVWQLGASMRFLPTQSLWAQAGRGFRAPSVADLYAPTSTATVVEAATGNAVEVWSAASNPELTSERSLGLELGYRWQTERARLGVSVYRDRYTDFIDTVRKVQNPEVAYEVCVRGVCQVTMGVIYTQPDNVGEVTVKGAELDAQWVLADAWLLRMAWSHNRGRKLNGDPLESINPDRGVLGLRYGAPSRRWSVSANLTHARAKKREDAALTEAGDAFQRLVPDFFSDAYTVLDVFGSIELGANLRLGAGVYNVFDRKYWQWTRVRLVNEGQSALHGQAWGEGIGRFSEPGRNVRATLSWRF